MEVSSIVPMYPVWLEQRSHHHEHTPYLPRDKVHTPSPPARGTRVYERHGAQFTEVSRGSADSRRASTTWGEGTFEQLLTALVFRTHHDIGYNGGIGHEFMVFFKERYGARRISYVDQVIAEMYMCYVASAARVNLLKIASAESLDEFVQRRFDHLAARRDKDRQKIRAVQKKTVASLGIPKEELLCETAVFFDVLPMMFDIWHALVLKERRKSVNSTKPVATIPDSDLRNWFRRLPPSDEPEAYKKRLMTFLRECFVTRGYMNQLEIFFTEEYKLELLVADGPKWEWWLEDAAGASRDRIRVMTQDAEVATVVDRLEFSLKCLMEHRTANESTIYSMPGIYHVPYRTVEYVIRTYLMFYDMVNDAFYLLRFLTEKGAFVAAEMDDLSAAMAEMRVAHPPAPARSRASETDPFGTKRGESEMRAWAREDRHHVDQSKAEGKAFLDKIDRNIEKGARAAKEEKEKYAAMEERVMRRSVAQKRAEEMYEVYEMYMQSERNAHEDNKARKIAAALNRGEPAPRFSKRSEQAWEQEARQRGINLIRTRFREWYDEWRAENE